MLRIPLENHGPVPPYPAFPGRCHINVEVADGGTGVDLTLESEVAAGAHTHRILTTEEARALAAALNHYAAEASR